MILSYTSKELDLLARIMRAEAISEGDLGMLMVGNVVVNRALSDYSTFQNTNSIEQVIYEPNQFAGTNSSLFQARPTKMEKYLAKRIINGEYYYPATNALWFKTCNQKNNCDTSWYNNPLAGKYCNHCFYDPEKEC